VTMRGAPLRGAPFTTRGPKAAPSTSSSRTLVVSVEANKKVQKKIEIVPTETRAGLGVEGQTVKVPVGYWRNYLLPMNMAKVADAAILKAIQKKKDDAVRVKLEEKARAQAFATALGTIGKFQIKKKVGDKDQIFGSVSIKEVVEAIYQQTGRMVPESDITIPDIKTVGTYECSAKLHPEVIGTFSVVIAKEKNALTVKASTGGKTATAGKTAMAGKKK